MMKLLLEAIKFNHDSTSATNDAINIRRNETLFVNVPEWQRGISVKPEDSPAAYALSETRANQLTIKAKFKCTNLSVQALLVRAIDARVNVASQSESILFRVATRLMRPVLRHQVGNVLGEVKENLIILTSGESDFETFELHNVAIHTAGVSVDDIAWRWQYRFNSDSPWVDFATTTHRIYTVLKAPPEPPARPVPWNQQPYQSSNILLPWTEVLDYACRWANGAQNHDQASTLVTHEVFSLGPNVLQFDLFNGGSAQYAKDGLFDCTAFLDRLRGCGSRDKGPYVNCSDCATITSTFANSVGCDLSQASMGVEFDLKLHRRIGIPGWIGGQFVYHEVAWEGAGKEDDELYDASLQLDGDDDETSQTPLLPTNLRFGRIGEQSYRFRLVVKNQEQKCQPLEGSLGHRTLGRLLSTESSLHGGALLEFTKQRFHYQSWAQPVSAKERLFILPFLLRADMLMGWRIEWMQFIKVEGRPPIIESFWRPLAGNSEIGLRIDAYTELSVEDARLTTVKLLTEFQLPDILRLNPTDFGDVAFANPSNYTTLFARANHVFLLRNIGKQPIQVAEFAKAIDDFMRSKLNRADAGILKIQRYTFNLKEAKVRDAIYLMEGPHGHLEPQYMFKFFSTLGEITLENGCLRYHPHAVGHHVIRVDGIDEFGNAMTQDLELDIT